MLSPLFRIAILRAPMTRNAIRTFALATLVCVVIAGLGPALAQSSASDVIIRLDQLENQMRQLTGTIEQLQYRNQQLEQALRRMQEDNESRSPQLGRAAPAPPPARPPGTPTTMSAPANEPPANNAMTTMTLSLFTNTHLRTTHGSTPMAVPGVLTSIGVDAGIPFSAV